jgi:hypothetical protein
METSTNKYLKSENWIQLIENELDGLNSKEQTSKLVSEQLLNKKELDDAFQAIRISRRAMAQEIMSMRIERMLVEPTIQDDNDSTTIVRPLIPERSPSWKVSTPWVAILSVAASLVLVIGLIYLFTVKTQSQPIALNSATDTLLVQTIFQDQFVASVLVAESKGINDRLATIKDSLNSDNVNIDKVLNDLSTIVDDSTHEVSFLRGYALLQSGTQRPALAITEFKKAILSSDPVIKEEAEWYLALAYLKRFDLANAYPLFKQLAESQNGHKLFAKEIVKKLTKK